MGANKYYCRINGKIYNMKELYDLLNKKEFDKIIDCLIQVYDFGLDAFTFEDVIKFNNNEIPADYNEALEKMRAYNSSSHGSVNKPKCPTCGSTNVKKIGTAKRAGSILTLGILSSNLNKTYECLNQKCKYKW